jgi:ferredoxin--NADP+ reductase
MITYFVRKITTSLKVTKIIEEAPNTFTFKFEVPNNIKWEPGAYAHFISSDFKSGQKMIKGLMRELSIMTHPSENELGFTTRIRENPSDFKKALQNLNVGDEIRCFKIANHIKIVNNNKPIVLISMGVGIATLRPILLEYLSNTKKVFITNINIDGSGFFVYKEELDNLPKAYIKNHCCPIKIIR